MHVNRFLLSCGAISKFRFCLKGYIITVVVSLLPNQYNDLGILCQIKVKLEQINVVMVLYKLG